MIAQQRISSLSAVVPELSELYKIKVRHYTIEEHTINVLNQFEKYFSPYFNEININDFRLLLLLHDIGKAIAYKKGNRKEQYIETIDFILRNQKQLNISEKIFFLFKAILENDLLGLYMQGKISLDTAYSDIVQRSKQINIEVNKFFYLLSVYYQCDTASYTQDAGGLRYLEYLFDYEKNSKIYNHSNKLLVFSESYQKRYDSLQKKIQGDLDEDIIEMTVPTNIKIIKGNIFNSEKQVIVNTVNCVGVMGKGIALVFKLRYPKMFDIYKTYCQQEPKLIDIGKLWLYKGEINAPWVLNFPTKRHWKYPSKLEFIEKGLEKFVNTYKQKGIQSIAFPLLGTYNGGLDKQEVLYLMCNYLSKCDIPIEIYEYNPLAPDNIFEEFKIKWMTIFGYNKENKSNPINIIGKITQKQIDIINQAIESDSVKSMISLIEYDGIGLKTMEKCFSLIDK
jgi:hypothetical protein